MNTPRNIADIRLVMLFMAALGCGQGDDAASHDARSIEPEGEDLTEPTTLAQRSPATDSSQPLGTACGLNLRPSTRCGDKLAPGDERSCRFNGRGYLVHAGKTMDPCKPVALVIDLPNSGETPQEQLGLEPYCSGLLCWDGLGSGWAAEADTVGGGFIVVSPERPLLGGEGLFNDEPDFLNSLVDEMKKYANIDPDKIYLSGSGDAGHLALRTACRHSQTFSGLSPNAGGDMFDCGSARRALSIAAFASKADLANYQGTFNATQDLARKNNCRSGPSTWKTFDARTRDPVCKTKSVDPRARLVPCADVTSTRIAPTTCTRWDRCDEDVSVVFCEVPASNSHGILSAGADAQFIYENDTLLNTPSVAWRVFQETW